MAEYIERDAVLSDLEAAEKHGGMGMIIANTLKRYVKRVPSADVAPVVHGKWNIFFEFPGGACWKCSVCGRVIEAHNLQNLILRFPYCHCGAKMESAYIIAGMDLEESK